MILYNDTDGIHPQFGRIAFTDWAYPNDPFSYLDLTKPSVNGADAHREHVNCPICEHAGVPDSKVLLNALYGPIDAKPKVGQMAISMELYAAIAKIDRDFRREDQRRAKVKQFKANKAAARVQPPFPFPALRAAR